MKYLSFEIGNRITEILNKRNEKGYKAMPKIGLAKGTLDNFKTSMPKADRRVENVCNKKGATR